jgi:hypothetical protein
MKEGYEIVGKINGMEIGVMTSISGEIVGIMEVRK